MGNVIQDVTTRFPVIGQEALDKAEASLKSINKASDLSGAKRQFTDLTSILDNLSSNQLAKIKKGFADMTTVLTPMSNALKNLPEDKLKKLDALIGSSTDKFKNLGKEVQFLRSNMDKLNLKPKEFAELNASLDAADTFAREFGNELSVMSEKGKTTKATLVEINNELDRLEEAGQSDTPIFRKLQAQAAQLKDNILDNKNAIRALASDTANLDAGIGAVRGLVAAFSVYQSILGLTGEENEELQKSLLKVTAAMALLQGIQEISNLAQKDNIVYLKLQSFWNGIQAASLKGATIATGEATVATTGLTAAVRGFLAASGIGLIILAFTSLVGVLYLYKSAADDAAEASEKLREIAREDVKTRKEDLDYIEERSRVSNDLAQQEIDLAAQKGAALDQLSKKQIDLIDAEINQSKRRIRELGYLEERSTDPELRKKRIAEQDELNKKVIERGRLIEEISQKELAAAAKIRDIRIGNIRDEYTRQIASLNERAREEIRINRLSNEFTSNQKIEFERATNEKIRLEKLKLDIDANKQLAIAFNELTQDQYQKQLDAKRIQNQIDLAAFVGNADAKYLKEQILEEELSQLRIRLDEDAALKIKTIQDNLIKDEYSKRIKNYEAQAKAEIKAFIGNPEDKAKHELEVYRKLAEEKAKLDKDAQERILDLRTTLIADEFTKQVQLAQDAYLKDYEAFVGNEKDKETYKLLLEAERNKKLKKLTDDAESKIKDVRISNIENVYQREREAAEKKYKEDIDSFVGSTDEKARYLIERTKQLEREIGGTSFLSKLFSLNKEEEAAANKALEAAIGLLDQYYNAKVAKDDAEVAAQEEKVRRLTELAEYGSQELLQLEEERLEASKRRRAEDLQDQQQIAALVIAANNAVSISEGIKAVIAAFGSPGGLFTGIATGIAVAATLASTILTLNNAFGSIPGFAEGTDYFNGKGTAKSDSNLALLSVGERVVDNETNAKLKGVKNKDLPKYVSMGMLVENTLVNRDLYSQVARSIPDIQTPQQPSKDYTDEFRGLKSEVKKMAKAMEKFQVAFNVTEDGIEGSVTKVKEHKERISKIANL